MYNIDKEVALIKRLEAIKKTTTHPNALIYLKHKIKKHEEILLKLKEDN